MSLIREFSKTGNFFFKYRSYFPLLLYILAILAIWLDKDEFFSYQQWWWGFVCFLISASGMFVRAITIGHTPKNTSGRNADKQIAEQLNTTGIYSIVRHPLYLGNFLMWLGLFVYVGSLEFLIFSVAFFWLYYERIMFAEEDFIRNKFKEDFDEWSSKTPAFLPNFKKLVRSNNSFSMRNVIKREYHGFFAAIFSFAFINVTKHLFYDKQFAIDLEWLIALIIGFFIYIIVRILVKKTNLLRVEGR